MPLPEVVRDSLYLHLAATEEAKSRARATGKREDVARHVIVSDALRNALKCSRYSEFEPHAKRALTEELKELQLQMQQHATDHQRINRALSKMQPGERVAMREELAEKGMRLFEELELMKRHITAIETFIG